MKLTRLLSPEARQGPPTQFHPWHLLSAFHTFCTSTSPIGRYKLGANLALGNGSIRSLIRFLRNQELIEPVSRQGHKLTPTGKQYCEDLTQTLVKTEELPQSSYTIDSCNFGCHLRQLAHLVTDGVEQRDAAMQAGASGATTFVQDIDLDTMIMAKDHRIQKQAMTNVLAPFEITTNDVLIVGSSYNSISAQLGAFAAILTLLKKL
jgi:predicted transcriptional regulator